MGITKIVLSTTFMLGLTATSALALSPVPVQCRDMASLPIKLVDFTAKGKKTVKIRSIGFLEAKLVERGFTVVDGRRHGELYFFRLTKDGYEVLAEAGCITVNFVASLGRAAREAQLALRFGPVSIKREDAGHAKRLISNNCLKLLNFIWLISARLMRQRAWNRSTGFC